MRSLLVVGGALSLALAAMGQLVAYLEGLRFDKFFWWPFVFLPLAVLAIGALATGAAVTLYQVARKQVPLKWGIAAAAMLVIPLLPRWFPVAGFADGLRQAVQTRLSAEQLFLLADDLRRQPIERWPSEQYDVQVAGLRTRHGDVFSLSPGTPRVSVDHGRVELIYGSGLIKHWGIAFSASCPRDYLQEDSCQEAYPGIWVYDDIY